MEREQYQKQIKDLLQAVETLLKSNNAMGERVAQLEKIAEDYEDLKAENAKLKGELALKEQVTWNLNPETWNQAFGLWILKPNEYAVWVIFHQARDLCKDVYAITKDGEFHKDSRFVQQIHAAAGSIMDNIAEGYERDGNKEFINFLYIAKGSCGEVRSQIIRASDVGFIDKDTAKKLYNDTLNLSKSISKFITSLKESSITGLKNK